MPTITTKLPVSVAAEFKALAADRQTTVSSLLRELIEAEFESEGTPLESAALPCRQCGGPVAYTGRGRRRAYCLTCRAPKMPLEPPELGPCAECSQPTPRPKYCSDQCRYKAKDRTKAYEYKRTLTCADCSKAIFKGPGSRPQGEARCQECRRRNPPLRAPRQKTCIACGGKASSTRCRPCATAHRWPNARPLRKRKREESRQRRARDRSAPGWYNQARRAVLLRTWQSGGRGCSYCPGPAESVDHVIPLVLGGTNHEGNLVPCCISCNANKGDRLIIEWRLAKRVKADRVVAVVPPKTAPKGKPVTGAEQAFAICPHCGALHAGKRYCSTECRDEWNRVVMRNRYRERVGIPLDAPLHSRVA